MAMTAAELRAKIRELMASGALPSEPPVVASRGTVEAFREPAVDIAENPPRLLTVPVLREQAAQARRSSKL